MGAWMSGLSDSAFIADLGPRERSAWRFLATLLVGLFGGALAALVVGVVMVFAAAFATGMFNGDPTVVRHNFNALLDGQTSSTGAILLMAVTAITNGTLAVAFVGFAALFADRQAQNYVTVAPQVRWSLLAWGLIASALVIGPIVWLGQALDPHAPPPPLLSLNHTLPGQIGYAVASILLLVLAAAAEEVVFRGWLLRQSAAVTRNPFVLMALNGVLFSAVHGEFAPDAFLTRAVMGAGFVYMTLRTGGIEFSTGAHAANNIIIVLLLEPLSLKPTPSTGLSADALLQDAFLLLSYLALTELTVRFGPLRRLTGVDRVPLPEASAAAAQFS
jgi:membrane protease YdiL (CAAX protease family)